jgi:sugar phosphate isomerase/epimerase
MRSNRRTFLSAAGVAAWQASAAPQRPAARIGVDLYGIRLNGWTAIQYLDYLAKINVQVAHLSTTREMSALLSDEAALKQVRAHAEKLGIEPELAMGTICPSAQQFDPKLGEPGEQLARVLNAAHIVGARVVRTFLGSAAERSRGTGIEVHMENLLRVLRNSRVRILDSGLKLALENHGGDLQAREVKTLVEEAGKGVLFVCLDSGNPPYILEDPHLTLEMLGPYAATTHIRDTAVWRVPEGIAVRWVNIGDGNVDIAGWIRKFVQMRPDLAVSVENIVSPKPQIHRIFDARFWDVYPKMPAWGFSRLLAIAERGRPSIYAPPPPGRSEGEQQCADLEISIRKLREILGAA